MGGQDGRERATSRAVTAAVPAIVRALAGHGVTDAYWFLAYYGYPVIWLITSTDAEKADVAAHGFFRAEVLAALGGAGVAPDLAERAGLTVESHETVNRDFEGNWYAVMK